jgi:murein L,D-transpeptidase YafK
MVLKVVFSIFFAFLSFFIFSPLDVASSSGQNLEKIPDSIVSISSGYVIAVDKKNQKLYVFKKTGGFSKVFEANCSTGKNQGGKQVSGDAKTPHGIFFTTRILQNPGPPETYGTLAFPINYPTVTDKKAGRNGTNIWIHGTVKPLMPFQSNGCVVLSDKDIHALAKFIQLNKTPIIISETIQWIPQNQIIPVRHELEKILASWTKGYIEGNIKAIDALYLEGNQIRGKKREALLGRLSTIRNANQHFALEPRDISILQQNPNAVIMFDQITDINKDNSFEGSFNRLSLENINNKWFIIDDVESPAATRKADRQIVSGQDTGSAPKGAVSNLVTQWAKSWKSGHMDVYRTFYASGFRSQGMNLNGWINHKIEVSKRSKNIDIRIDNLQISGDNNQSTATFTQYYSSNLLKSQGNKKLELRKINGEWKIYREIMQK